MSKGSSRRFGWWAFLHLALIFGLAFPAALTWQRLVVPEPLGISRDGAVFFVRPGGGAWELLLAIVAFGAGMALAAAVMRLLLGQDYDAYLASHRRADTPPLPKAFLPSLSIAVAALVAISAAALWDWYAVFGEEEIVVDGLIGTGSRTYRHADIVRFETTRLGTAVVFSDSSSWTIPVGGSWSCTSEEEAEGLAELVDFVSREPEPLEECPEPR